MSVDRIIVNYRIKCDVAVSTREDLLISQEEYEEAIKFELNLSKKNLHSLLISKLPEKKVHNEFECKYGSYEDFHTDINCPNAKEERGYNSAIDDMRKSIDEMFEVQNG